MLNDMPPELLGKIFGHLSAPDILGLKLVNRTLCDAVSSQPHLQYKCELAAAGMLDNPDVPGTLSDRRTSLRAYQSGLDDLRPVGRSRLPLGLADWSQGFRGSGDIFVTWTESPGTLLHFCRPSSASGCRFMKAWSFPLTFQPGHILIHPPSDLIVLADDASQRLYLRSMTTGEPHPLASHEWIEHDLEVLQLIVSVSDHTLSTSVPGRLISWNWRTGTMIFDRNDLRPDSMAFIGEDRLLIAEALHTEGVAPTLVLLDMSGVGESLATVHEVKFVCDLRYHGNRVRIVSEQGGYNDISQVIGQEAPFYPDPSRRVLGLIITPPHDLLFGARGTYVVRSETILRLAREKGEGVIEWDAWGKYTVALDMDEVPGAVPRYSISGSRFVGVYLSKTTNWAKVRLWDVSHGSLQHPGVGLYERHGLDKKARFRLIEGLLQLPQGHKQVGMLRDTLVVLTSDARWDLPGQRRLDIFHFW